MNQDQIYIYCDGACSGNPGPGGWGSIVASNKTVQELSGFDPKTTNNRMELTAALKALEVVFLKLKKEKIKSVLIFTDSVYVIRGITQWIFGWKNRGWKTAEGQEVSNQDLWIQLSEIVGLLKKSEDEIKLQWTYVRGHTGVHGNERCDALAVAESKQDYVDLYVGPTKDYFFDITEMPETEELPDPKKKSSEAKKTVWYISYVNGVFAKHATWKECEAVVKGRPAKFKKVSSDQEEAEVKKSWGIS